MQTAASLPRSAPCLALAAAPALAVEGGIGAYFMGTRDTFAGIVPPPGTYLSFTYDYLRATSTACRSAASRSGRTPTSS
jgi:hypothetical protein